jgi:hypothetical protein
MPSPWANSTTGGRQSSATALVMENFFILRSGGE